MTSPHPVQPQGAPGVAPGIAEAGRRTDDTLDRTHRELLARGYVQFHPALVGVLDGFKPALLLGHALYWTRTWLSEHPERDGWFWKTAREWRDATGLSPREQESARASLRCASLWSEQIAGAPARLFYRVDLATLTELLRSRYGAAGESASRAGGAGPQGWSFLAALLGRPLFYFRPLADIAGGVAAGLVLSHLLAEYRHATQRGGTDEQGFAPVAIEEARIALGLGTKVQRNAREALKRAGFVQEAWTHEQRPRLMVKLNVQAILACLSGQARIGQRRSRPGHGGSLEPVPVQHSLLPDRAHVVGRSGNVTQVVRLLAKAPVAAHRGRDQHADETGVNVGIRHRDDDRTSTQQPLVDSKGCPFVETEAAEGGPFVETGVALLSKLYTKPAIQRTTTPRTRAKPPAVDQPPPSRSRGQAEPESRNAERLIFPEKLDPALRGAASKVLAKAPADLQQALLDELAGHLAATRKTIENPVGWLHALVQKAIAGDAVLTVADAVAAARTSREAQAVRLAAAMSGTQAVATRSPAVEREPLSPEGEAARARAIHVAASIRAALEPPQGEPSP